MYILANMRVMSNSGELLGYLDISNESGYSSILKKEPRLFFRDMSFLK